MARRIIAAGVASALLAGALLALPSARAEAAKLKDFRIADCGEKVVATWTFCTARRVRTWQELYIWGTSAGTETEQILWEPTPTTRAAANVGGRHSPISWSPGRTLPGSRSRRAAAGVTNLG
jgi:hypothetical protein